MLEGGGGGCTTEKIHGVISQVMLRNTILELLKGEEHLTFYTRPLPK